MTIVLIVIVVLVAIGIGLMALCGAKNGTIPGRCHNVRPGPLRRCHHHHGVTLYDFLGLGLGLGLIAIAVILCVCVWVPNDGPDQLGEDLNTVVNELLEA